MEKENLTEHYEIEEELGRSEIGVIYKAKVIGSNEKRAIKKLDIKKIKNKFKKKHFNKMNDEDIKSYIDGLINEYDNMILLEGEKKDNNNAVKLYERFQNNNEISIIMELCDENLLNMLSKKEFALNPMKIYEILEQLNNSFKILSEKRLVHRTINLENILVKYLNEQKTNYIVKLKLTENCCSLDKNIIPLNQDVIHSNIEIMAPEILKGENNYEKSDLWSIGVLIYILAFKDRPYKSENEEEILNEIRQNGIKLLKKTNNSDLNDLIGKLLVEDPKKRLNWEKYFNHPFFRKNKDFRDFYVLMDELGRSQIGVIYKAKEIKTNEIRAIKILDKKTIRERYKKKRYHEINDEEMKPYIKAFFNEYKNMKIVLDKNRGNQNTVKLYEIFQTNNEIAIVMEFCDDNLLNIFSEKENTLSSPEIYELLTQLNNTFKILSEIRLAHRAIKLENILVKYKNEKMIYKLKLTEDSSLLDNNIKPLNRSTIHSNIEIMAPEILKEENNYEKSDLWSIGVIIYILAFKECPYESENEKEILNEIRQNGQKLLRKIDNADLNDLIRRLLVEDPNKRITWEEYFKHPFFRPLRDFRKYYILEKELGRSEFGVIYKAKIEGNNGLNTGISEFRAIKILNKKKIRDEYRRKRFKEISNEQMKPYIDNFLNEYYNIKIIEDGNKENKNIVKTFDFFQTNNEIAIVMELCDDNLLNIFVNKGLPFNGQELKNLLTQLNNSFKIMNEKNIIHRALTLENILVKNEYKPIYKLKLTEDSILLDNNTNNFKNLSENKILSNIEYMAPEILKGENNYEKSDLWSLGVIIYNLYFREYPFDGETKDKILSQIKNNINFLKKSKDVELEKLIKKLLVEDPNKRISWKEYFNHPFFKR